MKEINKLKYLFIISFYIVFFSYIYSFLLQPGYWEYGDMFFPVDYSMLKTLLKSALHAWYDVEFLGYSTVVDQGVPRLSYFLTLTILHFLIKDFSLIQYLWWVIISTIASFSMFLFAKSFLQNNSLAFISSLLYGLNPWFIDRTAQPLIIQGYAFSPLLIFSLIKLINSNKIIKKFIYSFIFVVAFFFVMASIHILWLDAIMLIIYVVYYLIYNRSIDTLKNTIISIFILLPVLFLVLAFYFLPLILYLTSWYDESGALVAYHRFTNPAIGHFYGRDLTVLNVIRLLGFHDSRFKGSILGASLSLPPPPMWTLISFLTPILVVLPLYKYVSMNSNRRFMLFYLYIVFIIGVFLSSSPNILGGIIFDTILYRLPLMNDPDYYVYLVVFSSCNIVAYSLNSITEKIKGLIIARKIIKSKSKNIIEAILIIFIIFYILYYNYPIFYIVAFGKYDFRFEKIVYPPESYELIKNFISNYHGDYRLLVLPPSVSVKHDWAPYFYYFSLDIVFLNRDAYGRWIMEATPSLSINFSELINTLSANFITDRIVHLLSLASTKFIVIFNDTEASYPYITDPKTYRYIEVFLKQKGIFPVLHVDNIYLFQVDDKFFLPRIYPTNLVIVTNSTEENAIILSNLISTLNSTFVIMNQHFELPNVTFMEIHWTDIMNISFKPDLKNKSLIRRYNELHSGNWFVTADGLTYNSTLPSILTFGKFIDSCCYMIIVEGSIIQNNSLLGIVFGFTNQSSWYSLELRGWQKAIAITRTTNNETKILKYIDFDIKPNVTYIIKIKVLGTLIEIFINNTQILSLMTDSYIHGYVGVMGYNGRARYNYILVLQPRLNEVYGEHLVNISNLVSLKYQKISPAMYLVNINSSTPFILVFSESYSPFWSICVVKDESTHIESHSILNYLILTLKTLRCINSKEQFIHLVANFYANAFYINKTGNLQIILFYKPELYLYIGFIISIMSFLIFSMLIILYVLRKSILWKSQL